MSKVIVLSETNCIDFLRANGFEPAEFYTDVDLFTKKAIFFNDVIVVVLFAGACSFSMRKMHDICKNLHERAISDDNGVSDLLLISDSIMSNWDDYFLYRDNPLKCVRYSRYKATSGLFDLTSLKYDKSPTTDVFLTDADYGYNEKALEEVRDIDTQEEELIKLIKVPVFK